MANMLTLITVEESYSMFQERFGDIVQEGKNFIMRMVEADTNWRLLIAIFIFVGILYAIDEVGSDNGIIHTLTMSALFFVMFATFITYFTDGFGATDILFKNADDKITEVEDTIRETEREDVERLIDDTVTETINYITVPNESKEELKQQEEHGLNDEMGG